MIGLILSIIVFNLLAYLNNDNLTRNQMVHIWTFTIALNTLVDIYIDLKYLGYWYFTKDVDWISLLNLTILIPPVNVLYINWFPLKSSLLKQIAYIGGWVISLLLYELIALLPQPFGYFHYGWWNLGYSAVLDPFLLLIVLFYYKWVKYLETLDGKNNVCG
ncbi:hypothetical protein [Aquibacillus kalidii]|uniref:hypothetical protein n=1 Tax=Aquibacillus kalidii TaxID=2762597 RepID=UPI001647AE32|nr:hypothetical protein [Aquibacillus kalidii]